MNVGLEIISKTHNMSQRIEDLARQSSQQSKQPNFSDIVTIITCLDKELLRGYRMRTRPSPTAYLPSRATK